MKGKIWVESVPGKGSVFVFTAVFGMKSGQMKNQLVLSKDLKNMRVLIVDDNEAARIVLEDTLLSFDLNVSVAASGSKAISEVESADLDSPYDLIIMDWQMPEMNGIQTSKIIKNHPTLKKIPKIIMLTAYGREEIVRQAEELGLDAFLVKPMNPSVLLETIMEAFGKKTGKSQNLVRQTQTDSERLEAIRGAKVLLVEDNEINQEIAVELLGQAGLTVIVAHNGQEALDKVSQFDFDCVLMDCQMPVMDGYEATRRIRQDKRFDSLPIIAITANAMKGDLEKCLDAGMSAHLSKPIDPNKMFNTLLEWIRPRYRKDSHSSPPAMDSSDIDKDTAEELPAETSGIDTKAGLAIVGNNGKLYRKLLGKFRRDFSDVKEKIGAALESSDFKEAEQLVHKLKGVSANIGAKELADFAGKLETAINQENKNELMPLMESLSNELSRILDALKTLPPLPSSTLEESSETTIADVSREIFLSSLHSLEPHLKSRKPKKCASAAEEILKLPWQEPFKCDVIEMNHLIEKYKFKEALFILQSLKSKLEEPGTYNE
jgi:two-component system sensor histidine kinase/response regulator